MRQLKLARGTAVVLHRAPLRASAPPRGWPGGGRRPWRRSRWGRPRPRSPARPSPACRSDGSCGSRGPPAPWRRHCRRISTNCSWASAFAGPGEVTVKAFSFLLPNTAPMPPRPRVWACSCMTEATFTRFSPATPMQSSGGALVKPGSSSASVTAVSLPQRSAAGSDLGPLGGDVQAHGLSGGAADHDGVPPRLAQRPRERPPAVPLQPDAGEGAPGEGAEPVGAVHPVSRQRDWA